MTLVDIDSESWVRIEDTHLAMGSDDGDEREQPQHEVTVSPFMISRYPVTNAQYAVYQAATGCSAPAHWTDGKPMSGTEDHPVAQVSWGDAMAMCAWLATQIAEGTTAARVHLPTEAQWEVAARGSEGREFPWGNDEPTPERANYDASFLHTTTPVTAYPAGATPDGVFDLAGNVLEWCRDWFGPYQAGPQQDPVGPDDGETRVLRGCTYDDPPWSLRAAARSRSTPDSRYDYVGFRVVWSEPMGAPS